MNDNAGAVVRRPCRTTSVPRRLKDEGESGAAAGHGFAQTAPPDVADQQRTPGSMVRDVVHNRVTREDPPGHLQRVPARAGLSPGEGGDNEEQKRQAALLLVLAAEAVSGEGGEKTDWSDLDLESCEDEEEEAGRTSSRNSVSAEGSSSAVDLCSEPGSVAFEQEIREATAGRASTPKKDKWEVTVGGAVCKKAPHHASADRAIGEDYPFWNLHFLRRACAHRKIPRMSSHKTKDPCVEALRSLDKMMSRASPFFAKGKAGRKKEEKEGVIPERALITFRNVQGRANIQRDRPIPFTFEKVDYKVADLFAAMDKEDAGHGGDSAGGSSSTRGAARPNGGGSAEGGGGTSERKGPHCMMRLVGILCEDEIRPIVIRSRLQANRQQLDTSAVGPRRDFCAVKPNVEDGIGDGDGGIDGTNRREAAKREGAKLDQMNRRGKKGGNKGGARSVEESVNAAVKAAMLETAPLIPPSRPGKSVGRQKQEEAESKSAAIALSEYILSAHTKFSKQIVEEETDKGQGYEMGVIFLKKNVAKLEKAMQEDD